MEENKEGLQENTLVSEIEVNKNETLDELDSLAFSKSETNETEIIENGACYTDKNEISSLGSSMETKSSETKNEEDGELEYGTMPGSWESYEAERKKNGSSENGVYPDDGRMYGGSYFGNYNGSYGQNYRQNSYSGSLPQKPKDKKRAVFFGVIGAIALVLAVSAFIVGFQLFNHMLDEIGNTLPQSGQQSGGGQGGGGQSGGSQNGGFTLEQVPADEHYKYSDVYQLTESTVVAIKSSIGSGSGVIISKDESNNDGYYIVTNNHVVEGGTNIKVTLSNSTVYDATLIGRDENTDLAVLEIFASNLKVATVGKSADLRVAEEILIIGNPLGTLGGSATNGIISAKNRTLSIDGYAMSLLQTNAAINGGNSGGGMFNMSGQLVGIVNAKFVSEEIEGIGFAIPIDTAKPIIEDLIDYGFVKGRANLGIEVTYKTEIIPPYLVTGWWITEISVGSDAEATGLNLDDLIQKLTVNGVEYSGDALNEFLNSKKLKTLKIGDELIFYVYRYSINDYKTISVTVTEFGAEPTS